MKPLGSDGDAIDVFLGPNPASQTVFVVDQIDAQGRYDEHKVLLGWDNEGDAVAAYQSNYQPGWKVGPVTALSMAEFKSWLVNGDLSKPLSSGNAPVAKLMPLALAYLNSRKQVRKTQRLRKSLAAVVPPPVKAVVSEPVLVTVNNILPPNPVPGVVVNNTVPQSAVPNVDVHVAPSAANVDVHNHVPQAAAPTIKVAAPVVTIAPGAAPVATETTVERNAEGEIVRSVTRPLKE